MKKHKVKFGKYEMPVPGSRLFRITLGILLCLGGLVGFLPVLGFWMVPLGLLILSVDLPIARRFRRKIEVWWGRRKGKTPASSD